MKRISALTLITSLLLAGCVAGTGRNGAPTTPAAAPKAAGGAARTASPLDQLHVAPVPARAGGLAAPPAVARPAFVAISAGATVTGKVEFRSLTDAFFADSAAAYWLQAVGPAAHTLLSVSTLGEDLYTLNGQVVAATSKADGTFTITGGVPANKPFVVNAGFARGHRMSAIAAAGATTVDVDEATSMVAELARWQLFPFAVANDKDIADLTANDIAALNSLSRGVLAAAPLASSGGAAPSVEALKHGAGQVLRNHYVEAFGSKITAVGTASSPADANTLADLWETFLGFRPLAITRVAGNGLRAFNVIDGISATQSEISAPTDVAADHLGNVYVAQHGLQQIAMVPKFPLTGPWLGEDDASLGGGNRYTIGGVTGGPADPVSWDQVYGFYSAFLPDNVTPNPDGAPSLAGGFPLYAPFKLALERAAAPNDLRSHVYFTMPFNGRVMMMPNADVTHFGRLLKKDLLYVIAGQTHPQLDGAWSPAADGDLATDNGLFYPTGLARDAAGNLWILDAGGPPGTGGILLVRESDGKIFRLPLTQNGAAYTPDGALELELSPDGQFLYVADTEQHWVFKVPVPTAPQIAAYTAVAPPAAADIVRVAGKRGVDGYLDTAIANVRFPDIHNVSDGIAEPGGDLLADQPVGGVDPATITALLNRPGALTFDAAGDLLIGDTGNGRVRLLKGGKLYTVAGGLDTRYITGDARLAYMPAIGSLGFCASDGTLLVGDIKENIVRRIHTTRGTLLKP